MSKRQHIPTFGNMDSSKLQPQAVDFEESILGSILINPSVLDAVVSLLSPEHFYKEAHKVIYDAICSLHIRKAPIDINLVSEELRIYATLEIAGGKQYLGQLTSKVTGSSKIEFYAQVVLQKFMKRQLIKLAAEYGEKAFEDDQNPFDLINELNNTLVKLREGGTLVSSKLLSDVVDEELQRIDDEIHNLRETTILDFGFQALDDATSGASGGDLIIIGARPGMGKSALAMSIAKLSAKKKIPVGLFSLEMKNRKLLERLFAQETNVTPKQQMRPKELSKEDLEKLKNTNLRSLPIHLNDQGGINIAHIETESRRLVKKEGVKIIFVDYLQLIKGVDKKVRDKTQEVSEISNKLKSLAMELDIPIIALAQLSRSVEETKDKRPMLSHLRQSGEIEQDADMIFFLVRPDYYNLLDKNKEPLLPGKAVLIVAKMRQGAKDDVLLGFNGPKIEFYDLDSDYDQGNFSYGEQADTLDVFSTKSDNDEDLPF
jgi:replicative DNA helicase